MPLSAVVEYLIFRRRESAEKQLFETFTATQLSVLSSGQRTQERADYNSLLDKVWGKEKRNVDTRTTEEIITDTLRKHGIKIRKKE